MGVRAGIVKHAGGDTSNGGLSSRVDYVTVVNAPGASEPSEEAPAVMLVRGAYPGLVRAVEAELLDGRSPNGPDWAERRSATLVGPMFGGCYVAGNSAITELAEAITRAPFYGAIALHDRWETAAQYAEMST